MRESFYSPSPEKEDKRHVRTSTNRFSLKKQAVVTDMLNGKQMPKLGFNNNNQLLDFSEASTNLGPKRRFSPKFVGSVESTVKAYEKSKSLRNLLLPSALKSTLKTLNRT